MEDLLAVILEAIAEAFLAIAGEFLISLLARVFKGLLKAILELGPLATAVCVLLLGTASGACSVILFPHPLVHPTKMHGVSLIISPILAGFVMSQFGRLLRNRGARTIQIESFVYGFAFALATAVVRFVFVR
jgi:hypothetical protein